LTRPTNVTKHVELIYCYFTTSPGGRADGRVGGLLEKSTVRLTQPSLAGTWAELGNMYYIITCWNAILGLKN
jgi:hypothetical protein